MIITSTCDYRLTGSTYVVYSKDNQFSISAASEAEAHELLAEKITRYPDCVVLHGVPDNKLRHVEPKIITDNVYTPNQLVVFQKVNLNYESLESNLSDNCTPVDYQDVKDWLHCSTASANGLLVSLNNRGIIDESEVNGDPIFMFTTFGVQEIYRLANAGIITRNF